MDAKKIQTIAAVIEALGDGTCCNAETAPPRHVVVSTTTRDLWFGELITAPGASVTLRNARHVYYYGVHADGKGVGSLATVGPASNSKIGPAVPSNFIANVSGILECSPAAVAAFGGVSWGK